MMDYVLLIVISFLFGAAVAFSLCIWLMRDL